MVEVGYYARIAKLSIKDTLQAMKDAGVDSLPGGGAEIFHPRVRKIICDHKVSGQRWLEIARTAHEIGQILILPALRRIKSKYLNRKTNTKRGKTDCIEFC